MEASTPCRSHQLLLFTTFCTRSESSAMRDSSPPSTPNCSGSIPAGCSPPPASSPHPAAASPSPRAGPSWGSSAVTSIPLPPGAVPSSWGSPRVPPRLVAPLLCCLLRLATSPSPSGIALPSTGNAHPDSTRGEELTPGRGQESTWSPARSLQSLDGGLVPSASPPSPPASSAEAGLRSPG